MANPETDYNLHEMIGFTDPRTINWTPSTLPVICISLVYLYIIYFAGPQFMKDRKPYSLKNFMQWYNIFEVVGNFWIVYGSVKNCRVLDSVWHYHSSLDEICGSNADAQLEVIWWFLMLKFIDLIETVMFVLRKRERQISLLHVYHHFSTVFFIWSILKFFVHGYMPYAVMLNAGMHVLMYSYYFLSSCGPRVQPIILPFKKWITTLQMVQLSIIILPCLQGFSSYSTERETYLSLIMIVNCGINLTLFVNFYINSYKKSSKKACE